MKFEFAPNRDDIAAVCEAVNLPKPQTEEDWDRVTKMLAWFFANDRDLQANAVSMAMRGEVLSGKPLKKPSEKSIRDDCEYVGVTLVS